MQHSCPVCDAKCIPLDVVDFNKSCEEARGRFLPLSGVPISYFLCERCGFAFAPEFSNWSLKDFETKIYNDDYVLVDPDYLDVRPRVNAQSLAALFGGKDPKIRHLDYGGGSGLLSELLCESGWQSASYDPFVDRDTRPGELGKFDLITAFEVFEHVPHVRQLFADLSALLAEDGVVLFSTLLSDGNIRPRERLSWWYASPRNGHVSLFSKQSLALLCSKGGYQLGTFSEDSHAFWKKIPKWAEHFLQVAGAAR